MEPISQPFPIRVANFLLQHGLLTAAQLSTAQERQSQAGGKLAGLLVELGYVTELSMAVALGQCMPTPIPPINVLKLRVAPEIRELVPREFCAKHSLYPIWKLGTLLGVAMANPLDGEAMDELQNLTNLKVVPFVAAKTSLAHVNSQVNGATDELSTMLRQLAAGEEVGEQHTATYDLQVEDLEEVEAKAKSQPVKQLLNKLLTSALEQRASDVHIEPQERSLKFRFRIDGALVEMPSSEKRLHAPLIACIKIMAQLKSDEHRLPQSGRARRRIGSREIDLRIELSPTAHGQDATIRLLDKSMLPRGLETMGLADETLVRFKTAIEAPHGMILMTGPTGSGKTTTLYTILQELNRPEYKVITVEDPVEYQLDGITQMQVNAALGFDFPMALRSILRKDPDIVMVGEIRDEETAKIAVQAAMTGHQLLSTLHTNDAASAIPRMADLGIARLLIADSLLLVCAQRLVRRICTHCHEEYQPDPAVQEKLQLQSYTGVAHRGAGCARCNHLGYLGRVPILEVLPITPAIQRLIIQGAPASELKHQAIQEGMKTLRAAAVQKALQGITSFDEVLMMTAED